MSKRKVTLKLTSQKDLVVHESEARTYGDLQKELPNIKWDGMRVVERSSKNTLQADDALLPAGDFLLFVVPEKVKSGNDMPKLDIDNASYNEMRSHASMLNKVKNANIPMGGSKDDIKKAVKAYYASTTKSTDEASNDVAVIENARKNINDAIDSILRVASKPPVEIVKEVEYVIKTSLEDLDAELASLKKQFRL